METNLLLDGSRLEASFRNLFAAIECCGHALSAIRSEPGERIGPTAHLKGHVANVVFPCGVFRAGVLNEDPPPIALRITKKASTLWDSPDAASAPDGTFILRIITDMIAAQFILYYETHWPFVWNEAGCNRARLQPTWAFARVVRNALGHGGIINISDDQFEPVKWARVSLGPSDDGHSLLGPGQKLTAVDLIPLLLEMDQALMDFGYD